MNKYWEQISDEKQKFINKYSLKLSDDMTWYSDKNNSISRIYFKHKFLIDNDILEILFRKYQLCFAKLKYFRTNITDYDFYKYHPFNGFIETELWDAEFFRYKKKNRYIDLRYLAQIVDIKIFETFIQNLDLY